MCGRYGRRADKQRIAEWMQTHDTTVFEDESLYAPSYNVALQTFQPVVRLERETGARELTVMRWGLVPYWTLLANSFSQGNTKILGLPSRAPNPWSRTSFSRLLKFVEIA